jgi:hypothetical protein
MVVLFWKCPCGRSETFAALGLSRLDPEFVQCAQGDLGLVRLHPVGNLAHPTLDIALVAIYGGLAIGLASVNWFPRKNASIIPLLGLVLGQPFAATAVYAAIELPKRANSGETVGMSAPAVGEGSGKP